MLFLSGTQDLRFKFLGVVITRGALKQAQKFAIAVMGLITLRIVDHYTGFIEDVNQAMPAFRDFTILISS